MKYRIVEDASGYFWPEYRSSWLSSWKKITHRDSNDKEWWLCHSYEEAFAAVELFDANNQGFDGGGAIRIYHL